MRGLTWHARLALVVAVAYGAPLACGGVDNPFSGGEATSSSGSGNGSGSGGECLLGCGNGGGTTGDGILKVVPTTATIEVVNGVAMPFDFNAEIDGSQVGPSWIVDLSAIAGVDANGLVSATGLQGGDVVVKADFEGQTATALVTVKLKVTSNPGGTTDPDQAILKGAVDVDPAVVWAYPFNGTVFPRGLLAPELMWNGSGSGDQYFLHFTSKYYDLEFFTTAEPPSRVNLDDASWKQLTESGTGGPLSLHVARLTPGAATATVIADHTWTIANGSLRGTVYYWANNLGRVVRIKPGAAAPEDFLPPQAKDNCSTCHSVSANGSTLIIGGDTSVSVVDLLTNTPALSLGSVGKSTRNWAMPAISPNGKVLVENNTSALPGPPGGSDGLWDVTTGQKILGTGLDGAYLGMPAFAPNGTKLAYIDNASLGLSIYNFDAATNQFSNPIGLVPAGGDSNLNCIAFPSVSPDAKWVVYHRGQYSNSLDTRNGPGNLYLASVDQPGVEVRLGQTNGDAYPFAAGGRDLNGLYEPTFAPLNSGGFAWVVFTGRRTYGNRLTGGSGDVKQLWVAAIDQNPQAGVDPSHPAFWVPGQDMGTLNMRGFWALDPCKQVDEACGTGSECCNQNCDSGVCKDPDPNECAQNGNHCDVTADCCDPAATCINNICSEPPPPQ